MPTTNPMMVGPGGIRKIVARWVITGELVLESATHLGSGEEGTTVDMALIRDRAEDKPLLSGASLAGGLRSYIVDRIEGYYQKERPKRVADVFGGAREDDTGDQSPLIVFDSICCPSQDQDWTIEIRDGVEIQAKTGLAEDHKKFDLEVLPPGTTFPVRFELLVAETNKENEQVSRLATALKGLEEGEIPIGARRSRGLGACRVQNWRAKRFDLTTQNGWRDWLGSDHLHPIPQNISPVKTIEKAIKTAYSKIDLQPQADNRERIQITVRLDLNAGLLIRSPGTGSTDADVTHLFSGGKAILPGTSLAGILRARALRIARVVRANEQDHEKWIDELFGPRLVGTTNQNFRPQASRLKITEKPFTRSKRLRLSRIKIDRFTGGVMDGALFDEEPIYRGEVEVSLELRNPREGETGLVLLLLKDLLTGDLPVGGTSSVGRGVFRGTATVKIDGKDYTLDPSKPADSATVQVLDGEVQKFHEAKSRSDTASQEETT